ncbi:hypothetical protein [Caulobacter sp. UC70_42]|uniref:hypothetical protein n=1 Tax=Caulobacter sp. UC70_42 TaxID=3374551 RepID=UPI003756DE09
MTEMSLRDTLTAAMKGSEETPAPADVIQVAPEPAPAPEPQDTEIKDEPTTGARERDETGKFKAVGEKPVAEPISEPVTAAEANPQPETPAEPIRVPPSLPAALKAKFAELSPEWREAFHKRDEDVNSAKAQWEAKAQRLNRYDEILAPHKDAWAVQGLDDHQAIARLVAAEKVLRETPAQGILYLAQSYGVDLRSLVGQAGQAQPQAQAPVADPVISQLQSTVQTLQERLEQQSQSASQASLAQAQATITQFANDPANLYFENVKDDVALLLDFWTGQHPERRLRNGDLGEP